MNTDRATAIKLARAIVGRAGMYSAVDLLVCPPFVNLVPVAAASDGELASRSATPDATGRFVVRGVLPARYRVEVVGLPSGWHLSATDGGHLIARRVK